MHKIAKQQPSKKLLSLEEQHKLFVADGLDDEESKGDKKDRSDITHKFFLRFLLRTQVEDNTVLAVYRDGKLYKKLFPGPHFLWNWDIIWTRWGAKRINQRTVLLPVVAEGRVKGPLLPHDAPGAANSDLACNVTAQLQLACQIADIEKYLSFQEPLAVFYSSFHNMVAEIIGRLPYDQYGEWATTLRDYVKERLQGGRDDSVSLSGLRVEDVFVTAVEANEEHDRLMLEMYKLVERARRELLEAQANRQRDREIMHGYIDQGHILNIAPSILALQDSAIGKELIERDAELRKLMLAVGLDPSINIQPRQNIQQQLGQGSPSSIGYLQPFNSGGQLPAGTTPHPNTSQPLSPGYTPSFSVSGSLSPAPPNQSQPASSSYPTLVNSDGLTFPVGNQAPPMNQARTNSPTPPAVPTAPGLDDTPITPTRQEQELAELNAAGFLCAGKGQHTPAFDQYGQPIPGSKEWVLEAYIPRAIGFLTMIFHCPAGYPITPPRVQVRTPDGDELKWYEPNVIQAWHPGHLLVEVAQEIDEQTPD
jgi:regulator of protease activity HflC (stomatin/prohibitin superfamily)